MQVAGFLLAMRCYFAFQISLAYFFRDQWYTIPAPTKKLF